MKVKVYAWTVWVNYAGVFRHFVSNSRYEANMKAWRYYQDTVKQCREDGTLDFWEEDEEIKNIVAFCKHKNTYIPTTEGIVYFEFNEYEFEY